MRERRRARTAPTHTYANEIHALPTRPDVAAKLLWLVDDRRSTPGDLSRVISVDPVLTVELLGCANSAPGRSAGPVTSISRSVAIVGSNSIGALVARAVSSLFAPARPDREAFWQEAFWSHSLATAVSSAAVARAMDRDPTVPYTLGLIHDIGAVLLHRRSQVLPAQAERIHELVGERALRSAGIPDQLCRAVRHHHAPAAKDAPPAARFIAAGDTLARYLEHGDRALTVDAFAALEIDEDIVDVAADAAQQDLGEIAKYLSASSFTIGPPPARPARAAPAPPPPELRAPVRCW